MLQPRLRGPSSFAVRDTSFNTLVVALTKLALCPKHSTVQTQLPLTFIRYASHAAQGRANGPKDSAGRRLGAKKGSQEYVIPGNIIFKQRGTKWFPGENCSMGRDHTIYSTEYGYVRYYKHPLLHPKRRYIGVALEKEGPGSVLPTPANAPSRRRLNMYAAPIKEESDGEFLDAHLSENSKGERNLEVIKPAPVPAASRPIYKPGTIWLSNYEIGKAIDKHRAEVKPFDKKDRWTAWRKRAKKMKEKALSRAARGTKKTKGKKSNKGIKLSK